MDFRVFKEVLDENGFFVDSKDFGEFVYVSQYTPLGEDWGFYLSGDDFDSIFDDLKGYSENFDVDEEVSTFVPLRGKNGVPESVSDLLEDQQWKKDKLSELVIDLEKALEKEKAIEAEQNEEIEL